MIHTYQAAAVLIVAAIVFALGAIILAQDFRNRTNQAFAILAALAAGWGFSVGAYLLVPESETALLDFLARIVYFCGVDTSVAFLYFALVFDVDDPPGPALTFAIFLPLFISAYLHFFTDGIIVSALAYPNGDRGFIFGSLRYVIDIILWGGFGLAFVILMSRYRGLYRRGREHLLYIFIGTYSTLLIAGVTNDILLTLGIFTYLWVGPTALILWFSAIAYAVARHQLFNVRIIAAESLLVFLWLTLLARAAVSRDGVDLLVNGSLLAMMVLAGVFMIRSMVKQATQRELIAAQAKEIEYVNAQQEALLHFISHEIKGYFAKSEAAFAGIEEGDFGEAPPELKQMTAHALQDVRTASSMAINILDASNLKKGSVSYAHAPFDLFEAVRDVAQDMTALASERGLTLSLHFKPHECMIMGDQGKVKRHVLTNLLDNAIRYTLRGGVEVTGIQIGNTAQLVIADTGVGLSMEDKSVLFTEGGSGKEASKVNVHSTGYGLFIAKQVVLAHGGTIRALSDGPGKGSKFIIEFPTASIQ